MSEETKTMGGLSLESAAETLAEQLQAGHRSRVNGTMLQGMQMNNVQFHEVMPDEAFINSAGPMGNPVSNQMQEERQEAVQEPVRGAEQVMPESYLNYAAQLLEQMRGVYSSSWDNCSSGSTWHGGHNHFYNPCSGADLPPSHGCPVYDCTNTCGCNAAVAQPAAPQPAATFYDDCAYLLQKICDQLNRIETMTSEMYTTNQQLFSYLIEYYNAVMTSGKNK